MSYKRQIKKAIKAAGLKVEDFRVTTDEFELTDEAWAGMVDPELDYYEREESVEKAREQVHVVADELNKMGYSVTIRYAGYGAAFARVEEVRGYQHETDFNNPASVEHY